MSEEKQQIGEKSPRPILSLWWLSVPTVLLMVSIGLVIGLFMAGLLLTPFVAAPAILLGLSIFVGGYIAKKRHDQRVEYAQAQFDLGVCYANGKGVEKDLKQAA